MNDETTYHMTPDQFRRHGHAMVDWIARYMEQVGGMFGRGPDVAHAQCAG
ncbi:MAG: hypothetical protein IH885_10995 [Myxococcales bacterium]|nr:hypothetical protein [Myxococcales bacterium]